LLLNIFFLKILAGTYRYPWILKNIQVSTQSAKRIQHIREATTHHVDIPCFNK